MRVLVTLVLQDVSVCILNRLRHFLHRPNGTLRARFWLAGRGTLHPRYGNTDQHQRVLESGIWGALTFCPCLDISSIAPMERYVLGFFGLQGGGIAIYGTATLTNTNVYSNEAQYVCSPSSLA